MSAVLNSSDLPGDAGAQMAASARVSADAADRLEIDAPVANALPAPGPVQRLEVSRGRLRAAMTPPPPRQRLTASASAFSVRDALKSLSHWPVVGPLGEAVHAWWQNHPLRPVAAVLTDVTNVAARPYAIRNPIMMVGAAALTGAALAWARPWRWLLRSALFAGLVPQLALRVVAKLPIESWLTMLSNSLQTSTTGARAARAKFDESPSAASARSAVPNTGTGTAPFRA